MVDEGECTDEGDRPESPWIVPIEYEMGASRWLDNAIDSLKMTLHPILASFSRETARDLPSQEPPSSRTGAQPAARDELSSPLYRGVRITHKWVMSLEEVIEFDVESFLQRVYTAADDIGGQLVLGMFEHISDVCDENGQVVEAGGRDFFEALIEVVEKMDIEFDAEGRPTTQIAVNPTTLAEIAKSPPTPEQEDRLRIVTEKKREAWLAARRRRELPDVPE